MVTLLAQFPDSSSNFVGLDQVVKNVPLGENWKSNTSPTGMAEHLVSNVGASKFSTGLKTGWAYPPVHGWLVVNKLLLLEPQIDLLLGVLNRVGTVDDVSAHVQSKITSDGTWSRLQWVSGTQQGSTLLDNVLSLPNGGQNWTRHHVG
ncbi:hypothetical protein OGATHE_003409 [Ogataea polymorpha]|uniref:Uncharacterized protein n=1 Tax=Ogataea polymorpha TaxID=460523 RepID=A0A9P8T3V8_9ASCO|nr:hypothetical protein OGATHE_003409 [Ogataea polymorpha]